MKPKLDHVQPAKPEIRPQLGGKSRKLGRLAVTVAGDNPVASYLASEIGHLPPLTGAERGSLSVLFAEPARAVGEVRVGPYFVAPDRVRVEDPLLTVTLNPTFDKVTLASKEGGRPQLTLGLLSRLRDINYLPAPERAAKQFVYDYFNQLVQLRQLSLGQTWVHASALTKGERTIALMAWGGAGKTSAMLQLVRHNGWRFLADDLTIIDESGCVYLSPQRLQVYPYNVEGDEGLRKRVLAGRGPLDRFHWYARKRFLGESCVRRRMHAFELFGSDAVADEGQLTDAFFLRRVDCPSFKSRDISSEHAAALSAPVLQAELDLLCKMQTAILSSDVRVEFPGLQAAHDEAKRILAAAFSSSRAHCGVIDVPFGAGPGELGAYFSRILEG